MLQLLPKMALLQQVPLESKSGVKKLVSVLATSTPMTGTREEAVVVAKIGKDGVESKLVEAAKIGKDGAESKGEYLNLAQVSCIRYPITFRKKSVSALFDSGNEVNAIHPTLAKELKLLIRLTDVRV